MMDKIRNVLERHALTPDVVDSIARELDTGPLSAPIELDLTTARREWVELGSALESGAYAAPEATHWQPRAEGSLVAIGKALGMAGQFALVNAVDDRQSNVEYCEIYKRITMVLDAAGAPIVIVTDPLEQLPARVRMIATADRTAVHDILSRIEDESLDVFQAITALRKLAKSWCAS